MSRNKEIKLCTRCGKNPRRTQQSANATWCKQCASEYAKQKRAADYAAGICMRCPNARREDSVYCTSCSSKTSKYRKQRRGGIKQRIVDYLGGKCIDCGLTTKYVDAYDLHHLDPTQKDLNIGRELSCQKTFEQLKPEIDKCVLICATCHRIRHAKEREQQGDFPLWASAPFADITASAV